MVHTVHGILQARIVEWVAFPFSRGSSYPGIEPRSPTLQADSLPAEPQGKPKGLKGKRPQVFSQILFCSALSCPLLHLLTAPYPLHHNSRVFPLGKLSMLSLMRANLPNVDFFNPVHLSLVVSVVLIFHWWSWLVNGSFSLDCVWVRFLQRIRTQRRGAW